MKTILSIFILFIGCTIIVSAQENSNQENKQDSIYALAKFDQKTLEAIPVTSIGSPMRITKEDSAFAFKKINPKDFEGIKASSLNKLIHINEDDYYKDYIPVIIPEYFILGTLSNHIDRQESSMQEDEVDYFYTGERALAEYLETYIKENLTRDVLLQKHSKGHLIIRSKELAKKIKSYFKQGTILQSDIFQTNEEIYSFLSGVYFRYGVKTNDREYQFERTYIESNRLFSILIRVDCPQIQYIHYHWGISFSFLSPIRLEKYFQMIEPIKLELQKKRIKRKKLGMIYQENL